MTMMCDLGVLRYRKSDGVVELVDVTAETMNESEMSVDLDAGTWTVDALPMGFGQYRIPDPTSGVKVIGVYDRSDTKHLAAIVRDSHTAAYALIVPRVKAALGRLE